MKKITQQLFYKLLFTVVLCCSYVSLNAQAPKVNSIERLTPTDATTDANEVTFRVTFSNNVQNVTTDDFTLSGTAAADGTVAEITVVSESVYDVKITGITNSFGTINLDIKGVDGSGTNDIIKLNKILGASNTPTLQQTSSFTFGQSFLAVNSGSLISITLSKYPGTHTASGTGTLELYSGAGFGGTLLASQNITVSSSTGEESYSFNSPASIVAGNTYTFRVNYSGSGTSAFHAQTGNTYPNGDLYNPNFFSGGDLYFKIYTSSGVSESLSNTLPATDETYTIANPPTLTTTDAGSITKNSAILGGNITSDYGNAITERGVVYSISDQTPEIGEAGITKEIEGGTTTGSFSESITGLIKGTTYYYRAYAINGSGTSYGTVKSFVTLQETPTVITTDATNITASTADVGGEINANGDSTVTEKGIVYSTTNSSPRISDTSGTTKVVEAAAGTTITESLTSLTTTQVYFYRAYATNSQGTGYGLVKRFTLNNGLHFLNSGSTRVTIPDNAAFDFSGGFTAEAWIKADVLNTRNIFSQYGASGQEAFSIFVLSSGAIEYTVTTNGSTDQYFNSAINISVNTWHHVAFTFDGTTMRTFIDGVAAGTKSVSGTMFDSTAPIEIGARNNAHFFDGTIDEVRFWNRALSETEINDGMNAQVPNNANGLVACYKMNQGVAEGDNSSITTLTDSGPNSLHGTLNNFTKTGTTSNFVAGVSGGDIDVTAYTPNRFTATGNWSNTANWSQGIIPSNVQNATIVNGVTVTIDVDDLNINDFTLESGATLNIPKDKEITVNGTFTTNGTLDLDSDKNDSGVLFLKGSTNGNVTYKRGGLLANKWSIVTPPVSGQTIKTFAENAANNIRVNTTPDPDRYAIGYYDDSQVAGSKWQYYDADVNSAIEFTAGNSYAISRATDGEVSFTGTLTANNVFKTLVADQWNAIGNPFTTYYPANKNSSSSFLNDNMNVLDDSYIGLYMWDNTQNKYIAVSEVDVSDRSLPPGQGFFVRMKSGQTEISFKEEKRSTKPGNGDTDFARNNDTTPTITLSISDNITTVKTDIKYFDTATQGLDPGYDIGNFNGASLDVFTHLLENSDATNFTIQSLPTNNYENMVVPVGLRANQGEEITFTAEALHLPIGIDVYLEDREKSVFTKLSEVNTNYKIVLENNINGIGRFYLHTTSSVLNTKEVAVLTGVNIYTTNNVLSITGIKEGNATLKIYSVLGKEVLQTKFVASRKNQFLLPKITSGVYVVQLETKEGKLNKKIIIE